MQKKDYKTELEELGRLKKVIQASLGKAPAGRMRCELAQGKYPQYYLYLEEEREQFPRGRYLRREEKELAKLYAQKEYDQMMLEEIERREKVIRFLIRNGETDKLTEVYNRLPQAKQVLVEPYIPTDEEYILQWQASGNGGQNTYPFLNAFTTERGEIVRSKSEKMIADKLFLKKIPYKYEAELQLGKKLVFPDFTILRTAAREEIYLEHFGMMDTPEYCSNALEKIAAYEEHGIYLGERLFATFETGAKPIDMNQVNQLLERILRVEK